MMKFQQVTTWASKKHIQNIMRDTPFGQENFLFAQNGAPNMMLEDIMHAKKYVEDIKNGKGAKQVVEGQLEVLERLMFNG